MEYFKQNNKLPIIVNSNGLFTLLAEFGGRIISSNDLSPDFIAQAKASNRMWVDKNSLGYVWEPVFSDIFPETEQEVEMFERCYPLEIKLLSNLNFKDLTKRHNIRNRENLGQKEEPIDAQNNAFLNANVSS